VSGDGGRTLAAETAAQLRTVLAAVDAGDIEADLFQMTYLSGAADALESLANEPDAAVSIPSL
jgi:hypothetical protein